MQSNSFTVTSVKSRWNSKIEEVFQDPLGNAEEAGGEGTITQLPSDGSEFRTMPPSTSSSMPNYRLPTPGGALPAGRLPPLNREDQSDSGAAKLIKFIIFYSNNLDYHQHIR